jgi:hypothetical protein
MLNMFMCTGAKYDFVAQVDKGVIHVANGKLHAPLKGGRGVS